VFGTDAKLEVAPLRQGIAKVRQLKRLGRHLHGTRAHHAG